MTTHFSILARAKSWTWLCVYIFFFRFFFIIGYYKLLNIVPCAISKSCCASILFIVVLICSSQTPNLSLFPLVVIACFICLGVYFFFKTNFYWSIGDLQCCVSFYCTAVNQLYIEAYFFFIIHIYPTTMIINNFWKHRLYWHVCAYVCVCIYMRWSGIQTMYRSFQFSSVQFRSFQSLSSVRLSATPWTAIQQASLCITNSRSPARPLSIESMMPSNHLILCCPLLLLPSIFPSIRVFSHESALHIRWPKYWSFSFNISPTNEHRGLISFRMDWLDLLAVQGTLKNLLQHHTSKASIL